MSQTSTRKPVYVCLIISNKGLHEQIENLVTELGYKLAGNYTTVKQYATDPLKPPQFPPDVIITNNGDHSTLVQIVKTTKEKRLTQAPVVRLVAQSKECEASEGIPEVSICHVLPINADQLCGHIKQARINFSRQKKQTQELAELSERLENLTTIERAKDFVMEVMGGTPTEAFSQIQQAASDDNTSVVAIAKELVEVKKKFFTKRKRNHK